MPLRSRMTLLAGIAASVALAGCQTSLPRRRGGDGQPAGRPAGEAADGPMAAAFARQVGERRGARGDGDRVQPSLRLAAAPVGAGAYPRGAQRLATAPTGERREAGRRPHHAAAYTPTGAMRASADIPAPPASVAVAPNDPPAAPPAAAPLPRLEPQPVVVIAPPILAHPAAPREFAKQPLPPYVVEPPDILLVQATADVTWPNPAHRRSTPGAPGRHHSVSALMAAYTSAGSTLEEVRDAVAAQLHVSVNKVSVEDIKKRVVVDVLAYNSKVYYVITDGGGYGEQVYPHRQDGQRDGAGRHEQDQRPAGGVVQETDLGRPGHGQLRPPEDFASGLVRHHAARAAPTPTTRFSPATGFTSPPTRGSRPTASLAKRLNPIERVLGTILLGSSTVNSIRNRTGTGGTGTGIGG